MRIFVLVLAAAGLAGGQVTYERIVNGSREPQNWLTYWGDYGAVRYRELKQINAKTVKALRPEWIYQTGIPGAFETTPLVVDGIMYFTAAAGNVYAIDARTGRQLWHQKYSSFGDATNSGGMVNRGAAILGTRLYMVTPEADLLALDVRTGHIVWKTPMVPKKSPYYSTVAPLVVKGKILVGISGGEEGTRGFLDAYDAETGHRAWRFWTVPAKGEPGGETWQGDSWKLGGGPTWLTGTFDPKLNTVYWGIGWDPLESTCRHASLSIL